MENKTTKYTTKIEYSCLVFSNNEIEKQTYYCFENMTGMIAKYSEIGGIMDLKNLTIKHKKYVDFTENAEEILKYWGQKK